MMPLLGKNTGLYTDHYELTMAQGYFLSGMKDYTANFDYFFRKNPFNGGYVVFAGLSDILKVLTNFHFEEDDCNHLKSLGFNPVFISFLKDFRFQGNIYSVNEGEVVFPFEPLLRVEGNLIELQLIESVLLNVINFQSLIATKASRIRSVAKEKLLLEFGLRRAQGLGSVYATKAAIIGGFDKTSNVFSAYHYGLQSTGTMAHSWVQSFDDELKAFREFVKYNPQTAVLLVDTYNTLKSGIPNAIKVAKELEQKGEKLLGIRLDSGDLADLSKTARKILDEAGLGYVQILISNQLDEYVIRSLNEQNTPVDAYGVGTSLVTGGNEPALDGVYKLSEINTHPKIKISENKLKTNLPGKKNIFRFFDSSNGLFQADLIEICNADVTKIIYDIFDPVKIWNLDGFKYESIMSQVMKDGKILLKETQVEITSKYVRKRLDQMGQQYKRFENPHEYRVGIGNNLHTLRNNLIKKLWMHLL